MNQFVRHFSKASVPKRLPGVKRGRGSRNTKNYDWFSKAVEKFSVLEETSKFDYQPKHNFPQPLGERTKVFFELSEGDKILGKVTFVLCTDLLPKTCDNFIQLCNGKGKYKYEGTIIHRIIKDSVLLCGDVELLKGKGGHSATENQRYFKDEGLIGLHNSHGVLSMINGGIDTNNSQFLVTLKKQTQLNGRNVAFGYLDSGRDVLTKCANAFTFQQYPLTPLIITKCGTL